MAIRTLESHLERMSVNDENEQPGHPTYHKPKVRAKHAQWVKQHES